MTSTTLRTGMTLTCLICPATAAAQELQPLTLQSMSSNISISTPAVAPDGRTLALTSNRSGRSKIWLLAPEGTDAHLLIDDEGTESAPIWSPDGRSLAFQRSDAEGPDLWLIGRDGTGLRRVTRDTADERAAAFAPDGRTIAFLSDRDGHQDIWLVDVATGEVRQLTRDTNPWDEFRWAPVWSPDGRHIAYVSNRSGEYADDLWVVDTSSGATRKLTADVDVMSTPRWSPDGAHIAFNGMRRAEFWYGDMSDIFIVDMPGGSLRRLEMNTYVSDGNGNVQMEWAPDSRSLFFRYEWIGDDNLWTVPVDGGVATQLTYEAGSFGNFAVDPKGEWIAYVRSMPTRGGEVHRFDLDGGAPVPITDWYRNYANLQSPERVTFPSRDGLYILGYRYLPPDFDPSRRYPALVQVHGGGNNANGNGFHVLEHLLAQEGFVVLAIEYRGSAGHGRAFQDLSYGDWAAGQGWDAVAAAEHLRAQPWSNGHVGIYGGSYGGIMTMAALTRDASPFAAAAPLYGIYDWETAYEDGDRLMKFWIIEGHEGFRPGEAPELFERTASIRHIDRVPTSLPFLVLHGELDRRAPFSQSVRLVEALRARGNPVEFHSYPDEQHGFRRPANRIDAYGRLIRHFDRYLKTPAAVSEDGSR